MNRVYIAAQYTGDGQEATKDRNVDTALREATWFLNRECEPFVPHLSHFWHGRHPAGYERWMQWCLSWVAQADAVYRIRGDSPGGDRETGLAGELGIPVFTDREECLHYLRHGQQKTVLQLAEEAVSGPRHADYGDPADNHRVTAALFSAYLGTTVTPKQVCFLNILQKIARTKHGRITKDTLVDICGYSRNLELMGADLRPKG